MTLTFAGRVVVVLAAFAVLLFLIGVAARVWSGQWDAGQVIAIAVAAPTVTLLLVMLWRWE